MKGNVCTHKPCVLYFEFDEDCKVPQMTGAFLAHVEIQVIFSLSVVLGVSIFSKFFLCFQVLWAMTFAAATRQIQRKNRMPAMQIWNHFTPVINSFPCTHPLNSPVSRTSN